MIHPSQQLVVVCYPELPLFASEEERGEGGGSAVSWWLLLVVVDFQVKSYEEALKAVKKMHTTVIDIDK
jgi:hypothetical protein